VNKLLQKLFVKSLSRIEKRIRIVISASLLTLMMFSSTFVFFDNGWFIFIPLFIVVTYILTFFAVLEGVNNIEWITLFIVPLCISIVFYCLFFLFPSRWITRIPFITMYGLTIYATLLCSNIFNVGVEKSLQLYRAAFSVNYFIHAFILFLTINVLLSFKFNFIINAVLTYGIIYTMAIQLLWTVKLRPNIERVTHYYAIFIALLVTELMVFLSFVPIQTSIYALFIAAIYYSLAGLIFNYYDQRLFKQTIREYVFVLIFVCIIVFLTLT